MNYIEILFFSSVSNIFLFPKLIDDEMTMGVQSHVSRKQ